MNLTALIVTWNRLPQLKNTVKATLALPFQNIVIVNNGSTDGTESWLEGLTESRIHLVHASKNLGGSEGFYLGSEYISKNIHTEWVVFYDDDAWPAKDFIQNFIELELNEPSIICAKVVDRKGNPCQMNLPWRRRTITFKDNLQYIFQPENFAVSANSSCEVISCSFVGSVVHASILKKTYNHIHRDLFIYFDDVYYGYYLHLQGFKLYYRPKLVMIHDIGDRITNNMATWKSYYLVRNMILSRVIFKSNSFFSINAIIFRIVKYLLVALKSQDKSYSVRLLFKAIKDGLQDNRTPLDR
ncbi:glycosyltransferase [Rosenbergiella epipactidis]|uniref:glycosyltransferase n=1 Tax=Rosenbergiella epipactidis TaxID=1544694 RepID=UPI001F4E865E|nr:glycosyltransferase [Rosenbergiella epipactidis]